MYNKEKYSEKCIEIRKGREGYAGEDWSEEEAYKKLLDLLEENN